MTYTLKVQIDPKGYTDYLEKIFKYGYKMKREMVNYFNRQEYRRQSSDDYKYLAEETKTLNELQEKIKETGTIYQFTLNTIYSAYENIKKASSKRKSSFLCLFQKFILK